MKDLFGVEISEDDYLSIPPDRLGVYQKIKLSILYRKANVPFISCKVCTSRIRDIHHDKTYNKCKFIGISRSESSDILVDHTCIHFTPDPDSFR
jgi:hypothetical protein